MNMAVDLSWWFQLRCSSLFVHQATNKPVNNHVQAGQLKHVSQACQQVARQKQAVRFYVVCSHPTPPNVNYRADNEIILI